MISEPWIIPGQVQIDAITQVIDHPDVKIYEVDLPFTFMGSFTHFIDDRRLIVRIHPGQETLGADKKLEKPTEILFLFEVEAPVEWISLAEAVRNVARICLYRSHVPF